MDNLVNPCVFSAYLIAFRKKPDALCLAHDGLFDILIKDSLIENGSDNKRLAENKWITTSENQRKVQFVEFDDYIFARLACKPYSLQYKEINFSLSTNDLVEVVINFPAVYEKYSYTNNDGEKVTLPRKFLSDLEKIEYATKRLSDVGIKFNDVSLTSNDNRTAYFRKNKKIISLLSYEVRVIATVTNVELLHNAYMSGIGRRKTWGFGMLRITKLEHNGAQ